VEGITVWGAVTYWMRFCRTEWKSNWPGARKAERR